MKGVIVNSYFHGTSAESAENILLKGFSSDFKNWNESEDNLVYLWDINECRDRKECLHDAYHSACISAAIKDSKKDYIVIFEIIGELYVNEDKSCDISDDEIRTCILSEKLNNVINKNIVKIVIHKYKYQTKDRAKYLYNTYHYCGGTRWDSIENHIVNMEALITDLLVLEKQYDYEYWFRDIYEDIE